MHGVGGLTSNTSLPAGGRGDEGASGGSHAACLPVNLPSINHGTSLSQGERGTVCGVGDGDPASRRVSSLPFLSALCPSCRGQGRIRIARRPLLAGDAVGRDEQNG